MSLDSVVSLLVAVSDLKAVRAVTRAINANLPKNGPLGTIRPSSAQLYARPRRYYSPMPARVSVPLTSRPVSQPSLTPDIRRDRYDPTCRDHPALAPSALSDAWVMDGPTRSSVSPIDPPWKHLPAVREDVTVLKVQVVRPKVDLITKGTLLDLFV